MPLWARRVVEIQWRTLQGCQGRWEVLKSLVLERWMSPWLGLFIGFREDYRNGRILNLFTLFHSILSKMVFVLWSAHNRKKNDWVCCFSLESFYQFTGGQELTSDYLHRVNQGSLTLTPKWSGMNVWRLRNKVFLLVPHFRGATHN